MGVKRTSTHILEQFMWSGVIKDVKEMVCVYLLCWYETNNIMHLIALSMNTCV